MRPYSSSTTSTISSIEAGSPMSVVTASAWPPAFMISADTEAAVFSLRSAMMAMAPASAKALAKARPMPWPAPVTMATRSFRDDSIVHAAPFSSRTWSSRAARAFHGVHHGLSPRSSAMMPALM